MINTVVVSLQYEMKIMKFPVNPESLKLTIPSPPSVVSIERSGQVGIPVKPNLRTISIDSFFWKDNPDIVAMPPALYVAWLRAWQKSKKPARLLVTKLNYCMYVSCSGFEYDTRAGEEDDVYFSLQLTEYKPYSVSILGANIAADLFAAITDIDVTLPVLVDIPRPARINTTPHINNKYLCKAEDSIASITKKFTGAEDDFEALIKNNPDQLAVDFADLTNKTIILPSSWSGLKYTIGEDQV